MTCFSERVHELHLFGLSKRKPRSDLITKSKYLHEEKLQDIKELFTPVERGIKRINGWKLRPEKFKWDARHILISMRTMNHCNKLAKGSIFPLHAFKPGQTFLWKVWFSWTQVTLESNYWVQYRSNREKFNGLWYMTDETRWTNAHPKAKLY